MADIVIRTNNVPRDFVDAWELSRKSAPSLTTSTGKPSKRERQRHVLSVQRCPVRSGRVLASPRQRAGSDGAR